MMNNIFQSTWFDLIYCFLILNGLLSLLEVHFYSRLVNQVLKWYYYLAFFILMYAVYAVEIHMQVSFLAATVLESATLFIFGWLIIMCPPALSAIATILTITIMQVVNGIFQSFSSLVCPILFQYHKSTALFLLINNLFAIAVIFLTYHYVLKSFSIKKSPTNRYVMILLFPVLFVLLVIQHVFSLYGQTVVINSNGVRVFPQVNDWEMLLIQLVAYFCLMAILFAYRKLSEGFELQMRNALLEQQADMQKDYMQELKTRYEQTRSFRHDVKNHLTVLSGLLKQGQTEKASEFLNKLELVSDALSFPCQTGNAVIDMLLGNKLGLARQNGVRIDCAVKIPPDCTIDEMDLCIVFSNAVDNAINACSLVVGQEKYISLSAYQKGKFLMVDIENSRSEDDDQYEGPGIGLSNIKSVAEKYNGVANVESTSRAFKLSVLFVIPLHSDSI